MLRPSWLLPGALLLAYLATQYGSSMRIPFINEDYAFLDATRGRSLLALLSRPDLYVGPWIRPWSQGIHYWVLQSLFGVRVAAWHATSLLLGLIILISYYTLVLRVAGRQQAGVATACAATIVAWGLPLTWIAGVQDLWMLVFALAVLHAVASARTAWATIALGLALLSKETAAVLPALAFAWLVLLERMDWKRAFMRTLPLGVLTLGWALIHPALGGRWWHSHAGIARGADGMSILEAGKQALLAIINLDVRPHPESGWVGAIGLALLGTLPLVALIGWSGPTSAQIEGGSASPSSSASPRRDGIRIAMFGLCWAVLGCVPLLFPALHWHSYYSLFASLGAWLALSVPLSRFPRVAMAVVLGLAMLRSARSTTVLHDWGEQSYVKRAGLFLDELKGDLLAKCPSPARYTRFYFRDVPSEVGFLIGDGPSLRVWYSDSTLRGGYFRDFRVRGPSAPAGTDRFFRHDPGLGWVELIVGPEDVAAARQRDTGWAEGHQRLVLTLARGDDWRAASAEYAKLAEAFPDSAIYPYLAGLASLTAGDSLAARPWLLRAAEHPAADDEMRGMGRIISVHEPRVRAARR